ncbi:MAG: PD-(D/E)XK nuclease family protein [Ferrimicrobium sp.]
MMRRIVEEASNISGIAIAPAPYRLRPGAIPTDHLFTLEEYAHELLGADAASLAPRWLAFDCLITALEGLGLSDPYATARTWLPALVELARHDIDEPALGALGERGLILSRALNAWRSQLDHQGLLLGPDAIARAAALTVIEPQKLMIIGYETPTPTEERLINRIAGDDTVVCLSPLGSHNAFRERLLESGWTRTQVHSRRSVGRDFAAMTRPTSIKGSPKGITAYRFDSDAQEVCWVLAAIKERLIHGALQHTNNALAIATTDPGNYLPILLHYAKRLGVPVATFERLPLATTQLGRLTTTILSISTSRVDAATPLALRQLHESVNHPDATPPRAGSPWGAFVNWLTLLLSRIAPESAPSALRDPRERRALSELIDAANELDPTGERTTNLESFRSRMLAIAATLDTPATSGGGVDVITPASLGGAKYRTIYLLGAVEGRLPPLARDDPVLPFFVRSMLTPLPKAADIVATLQDRTRELLTRATEELILCVSQQINQEPQEPSSWLDMVGVLAQEPPPPPIVTITDAVDQSGQPKHLAERIARGVSIERSRLAPTSFDRYDGALGTSLLPDELTVTGLRQLGRCGFQWYVGHVLRARTPPQRTLDPLPTVRGILIHHILDSVISQNLPIPVDPSILDQICRQAEHGTGLEEIPAWWARRMELVKQLSEVIAEPAFLPEGATPLVGEFAVRGTWHGLKVRGRIDRIDRLASGDLRIVDYKSGSNSPTGIQDESGKFTTDIQLPIYRELVDQTNSIAGQVAEATFFLVGSGHGSTPRIQDSDYWEVVAIRLREQLIAGNVAVLPDRAFQSCRECNYQQICRVGPRVGAKREIQTTP